MQCLNCEDFHCHKDEADKIMIIFTFKVHKGIFKYDVKLHLEMKMYFLIYCYSFITCQKHRRERNANFD